MARGFARRFEGRGSLEAALSEAFRACMSRKPSRSELHTLAAFWNSQRNYFASETKSAKEVLGSRETSDPASGAAWVATLRVLLNLDEFITRE